ncbi:cold-shock protein [Bradyrhizobium sp. CCBAU 25338]|uniref:cold-shock protein n=1 Tax=Bradyrhizobium sp. CCBAU 25338 TaxID=1641877 RepID=UPI003FA44C7C
MIGTVKFWNLDKAFGFISLEGEPDVFVHLSGLSPECSGYLTQGDEVQFRIIVDAKTRRQKAVEVSPRKPSVAEALREMRSLRQVLDNGLKGPGANDALTDLRHLLNELEQIAAA